MSGGRGGRRGQNSSVSDTSQDEINALIREQIHGDFLDQIKILLRKEVRSSIQDEIKDSIRAEMQAVIKAEVSGRLERLETSLQQMAELSQDVAAVKQSIDFTSQKLDDLRQTVLPGLASHIEQVATSLALQTLDLDMHRRKWSITIHGLKGKAKEEEAETRQACVDLATSHLLIPDASTSDFAACHRLAQKDNAGVIIRFRDLVQRNLWLSNAKNLRTLKDPVSISPDLPPVLRPLKTELLHKRKAQPATTKKGARIKYLKQWPYVELTVPDSPTIRPSTSKESIVESVLGFKPYFLPAL